jgi:hypothetical protein
MSTLAEWQGLRCKRGRLPYLDLSPQHSLQEQPYRANLESGTSLAISVADWSNRFDGFGRAFLDVLAGFTSS